MELDRHQQPCSLNMTQSFPTHAALLLIDVQRDFFPGGSLPVQPAPQLFQALNDCIDAATAVRIPIVATRDWHPPDHRSFDIHGGPWPVHCVRDTPGAQFCEVLRLPDDAHVLNTGVDPHDEGYSAFANTELEQWLRKRGVTSVWIAGVALEYCVRATALDALKAGFETHLLLPATSPVDPEHGIAAAKELAAAGCQLHDEAATEAQLLQ